MERESMEQKTVNIIETESTSTITSTLTSDNKELELIKRKMQTDPTFAQNVLKIYKEQETLEKSQGKEQ